MKHIYIYSKTLIYCHHLLSNSGALKGFGDELMVRETYKKHNKKRLWDLKILWQQAMVVKLLSGIANKRL